MKMLLIANPIASGGDAARRMGELARILSARGHRIDAYLTRFAGDGRRRVSRLEEGLDRIVVVGGDGTFNEIVNGLSLPMTIPLVQLPTGNANLLGRDLSLPQDPAETADLLETGRVIWADMGDMNGTRFVMVAGAGFDARVTEEMKRIRKGRVGNLTYLGPIFRALGAAGRFRFAVTVDDGPTVHGAFVLVCNVRSYAGICQLAFEAGVSSGVLDIVVVPRDSAWYLLKLLWAAWTGRVTRLAGVIYRKGRRVTLRGETAIPMQVDGDFAGRHAQVDIRLLPEKIPLIVPRT